MFCFTPRGRLIALPRGATPIDFAYSLHTDIGDTAVGAKINGQIVPLVTQLRSGDEVEIIRDQNHLPPSNWETIAATGKARSAIRRAVRQQQQHRAHALGEHMLSMLLEREGVLLDDTEFKQLAEALNQPGKRELMVSLGEGRISSEDLDVAVMDVKGIKRRRKKTRSARTRQGRGLVRAARHGPVPLPRSRAIRAPARAPARAQAQLDFNTACGSVARGRGAGRSARRHPRAGQADPHLSDPFRRAGPRSTTPTSPGSTCAGISWRAARIASICA